MDLTATEYTSRHLPLAHGRKGSCHCAKHSYVRAWYIRPGVSRQRGQRQKRVKVDTLLGNSGTMRKFNVCWQSFRLEMHPFKYQFGTSTCQEISHKLSAKCNARTCLPSIDTNLQLARLLCTKFLTSKRAEVGHKGMLRQHKRPTHLGNLFRGIILAL